MERFATAALGNNRAPDACGLSSAFDINLAAPPTPMKWAMDNSLSVGRRPMVAVCVYVAYLQGRPARGGIADRIAAVGRFGDGVGVLAVTELGAGLLDGAEPC